MDQVTVDQLTGVAQSYAAMQSWRNLRFVGAGAFKATYLVETPKPIALKVFAPGAVNLRSVREIEVLQRVSGTHNSLPRFLGVDLFDYAAQQQFVISLEEYISGTPLPKLTIDRVAPIAIQLAEALELLAAQKLVHRDIKPDNLLLAGERPVLIDFGLCRDLAQGSLTQTWAPQGPCTPYFAAPEQLNNEKELIDHRTDQFGLGVTLSVASFGGHPFARPGDHPTRTIERVASREPMSDEFIEWARRQAPALVSMVSPWSFQRYRRPSDLTLAWKGLR